MPDDKVVLVVDDDHAVLETMQLLLEGHGGFEVHGALGALGATAFLTSNVQLDVIVADVILTGETSGIQLCELARRRYPQAGVVIISAESERAAAMTIAASVYLRKPFGGDELVEAIKQALSMAEKHALGEPG